MRCQHKPRRGKDLVTDVSGPQYLVFSCVLCGCEVERTEQARPSPSPLASRCVPFVAFGIPELHCGLGGCVADSPEQLVHVEWPALSLNSGTHEFHGYLGSFAEHYVVQLSIFHPRC
jgi:hypothetical protein